MRSEQLRAARALLRMDQLVLSEKSGVSIDTINALEATVGDLREARVFTVKSLQSALEEAGVIFVEDDGDGPGVRLRTRSKMPIHRTEGEAGIIENNDM